MACDEGLVDRIRDALHGVRDVGEIRMFGGVCFTLNGNMISLARQANRVHPPDREV